MRRKNNNVQCRRLIQCTYMVPTALGHQNPSAKKKVDLTVPLVNKGLKKLKLTQVQCKNTWRTALQYCLAVKRSAVQVRYAPPKEYSNREAFQPPRFLVCIILTLVSSPTWISKSRPDLQTIIVS